MGVGAYQLGKKKGGQKRGQKGVSPSISAFWCHSMKFHIVLEGRFYLALKVSLC